MPENEPEYLLQQAERCRRLARTTTDNRMHETLLGMAREYKERAERVRAERAHKPDPS